MCTPWAVVFLFRCLFMLCEYPRRRNDLIVMTLMNDVELDPNTISRIPAHKLLLMMIAGWPVGFLPDPSLALGDTIDDNQRCCRSPPAEVIRLHSVLGCRVE